jgi:hypothetical protein
MDAEAGGMSYYIYGLRVIGDTECRYVGMTSRQPEDRLKAHVAQSDRRVRWANPDPLQIWLHENKGNVEAFKIGKVETEAEARAMERTIIALSLRLGQRLFNRWHVPNELRVGWKPYNTVKRLFPKAVVAA